MAAAALTCPKCKKSLRTATPLAAGKKVKCPGCQTLFTVPGAGKPAAEADTGIKKPGKAAPPAKKPAPAAPAPGKTRPTPPTSKAKPPLPAAKTPRRPPPEPEEELEELDEDTGVDDEGDEDEDERPSRGGKKKAKSGGMLFVLLGGGVALLALVAVALFVWPGFLNSPTTPVRPNSPPIVNNGNNNNIGNPPIQGASANALLAYLPADANFVVGVKANAPIVKKLLAKVVEQAAAEGQQLPEPDAIVAGGNKARQVILFQSLQPFDKDKFVANGKMKPVPGKSFYADAEAFMGFPSDRLIIVAPGKPGTWTETDFAEMLASQKPRINAELSAQIATVENASFWAVVANQGDAAQGLVELTKQAQGLEQMAPGIQDALTAVGRTKFVRASVTFPPNQGGKLDVSIACADDADAKKLSDFANDFWTKQGKLLLPGLASGLGGPGPQLKFDFSALIKDVTNSLSVSSNADTVMASLQINEATLKELEKIPLLGPGAGGPTNTINLNNLKQLAIAMHSYHDTYKKLPQAASFSPDGKPLLSWRVHILPFVEEGPLYAQFDLNAPWDDPKNMALLNRMPKLYAIPGRTAAPGHTFYQVFVADEKEPPESTPLFKLSKDFTTQFAGITDGTSNTIMVAEAESATPWTKPDDLPYSAKKPLPKLGDPQSNSFHVVMADGFVVQVKRPVDELSLRRAITAKDNQVLPPNWMDGGKAEPLPILPKTNQLPEKKATAPEPKADPLPKIDPAAKTALLYMPATVDTVVGIDIERIKSNPITAPLVNLIRDPIEKSGDKMAWEFVQNWQYICAGAFMDSQKGILYIRTKNPMTEEELRKGANLGEAKQIAGLKYYEVQLKDEKGLVTMLDPNTLLVSTLPENDFTELLLPVVEPRFDPELARQIGKVGKATAWAVIPNKGPINDAINMTDRTQFGRIIPPDKTLNKLKGIPPELASLVPMVQRTKAFSVWSQLQDNQVEFNLGVVAADKAEAEELRSKADEFWKTQGKAMIGLVALSAPKTFFDSAVIVNEVSNTLQFKSDGNLFYASLTLSKSAIDELQKASKGLGNLQPPPAPGVDPLPKVNPLDPPAVAPPNSIPGGDMAKLQGKWKLASMTALGKTQNYSGAFAPTFTVTNDKIFGLGVFFRAGPVALDVKMDSSKTPKTIDFSLMQQGGNIITVPGVYELSDDEFKFCVSAPMAERPVSLEAPLGRPVQLYATKRVKE